MFLGSPHDDGDDRADADTYAGTYDEADAAASTATADDNYGGDDDDDESNSVIKVT